MQAASSPVASGVAMASNAVPGGRTAIQGERGGSVGGGYHRPRRGTMQATLAVKEWPAASVLEPPGSASSTTSGRVGTAQERSRHRSSGVPVALSVSPGRIGGEIGGCTLEDDGARPGAVFDPHGPRLDPRDQAPDPNHPPDVGRAEVIAQMPPPPRAAGRAGRLRVDDRTDLGVLGEVGLEVGGAGCPAPAAEHHRRVPGGHAPARPPRRPARALPQVLDQLGLPRRAGASPPAPPAVFVLAYTDAMAAVPVGTAAPGSQLEQLVGASTHPLLPGHDGASSRRPPSARS